MNELEILEGLDKILQRLNGALDIGAETHNYTEFYYFVNDEILREILTLRDIVGNSICDRNRAAK